LAFIFNAQEDIRMSTTRRTLITGAAAAIPAAAIAAVPAFAAADAELIALGREIEG